MMGYRKQNNPYACTNCETKGDACRCCDFKGDTATFGITLQGCVRVSGCAVVTSTRIRSGDTLPPGVSYPSPAPCGAWPITVGDGPGCTFEDVSWGGQLYMLAYCDGEDYKIDHYCYDADEETWVFVGTVSASSFECLKGCEVRSCGGVEVEFCCTFLITWTVPDLPCCCPDEPCEDCFECTECGCSGAVYPFELTLSDGTNSATINNGYMPGACTWFTNGTAHDIAGCNGVCTVNTVCSGGVWTISCGANWSTTSSSVQCDPLEVTFTPVMGCDGNTYTLVITE